MLTVGKVGPGNAGYYESAVVRGAEDYYAGDGDAPAATLCVTPQKGSTMLESVIEWCRGRQVMLIVDNCEHVIDGVGELVAAIIARCPTVTVVATSREPLGIYGEWVHRVQSLDRHAAVELFEQRALAADSSFVLDDAATAARLCERLDGIPLAIELAAARARSMSLTDLYERVDDRFQLLRGSARGRPDRHQTLRATVAWSYELLAHDERIVFERTSVFPGSFDIAAAEAICSDDTIDRVDVPDILANLVDKSIVLAERHATGMRYRLLETIRDFGDEQLGIRGQYVPLLGPRRR
jgi:predicted ATPase